MIAKLAFLASAATLASASIHPAKENLSPTAQAELVAALNAKRALHGSCNSLKWDAAIAEDIRQQIVDGNGQCASISPDRGLNFYTVWVTTFMIVPPPVWPPSVAVDEWYNSGNGMAFENVVWSSATKVGCAQCRDGFLNQGHMVYVYCRFEEVSGTVAVNVNPVGGTCNKCAGVSCNAPTTCQLPSGACNPTTGGCEYLPKPDGTQCDDGDKFTQDDQCKSGSCAGDENGCRSLSCVPLPESCQETAHCVPKTPSAPASCAYTYKPVGESCGAGKKCAKSGAMVECVAPGSGACRVAAAYEGMPMQGERLLVGELVHDHMEAIGAGYLKDFSMFADGGVDGEVLRLTGDTVHPGSELRFECPPGCGDDCEIYLLAYHCPACPRSAKNEVIGAAQEAGWEMAPCAPKLFVGSSDKPRPMVSMRKVLSPGGTALFPTAGELNYFVAITFSRSLTDCTKYATEAACKADVECTFYKGHCSTTAWCARRFAKGPHNPSLTPGCSVHCLV